MKKLLLSLLLLGVFTLTNAQDFKLVAKQSKINWKGYGEVGGFSQEGSIKAKGGDLKIVEGKLINAALSIDMKTIDSKDKQVSKHLKNKDFFYVKKHPESTLEMIAFDNGVLKANLSIRGISKTIECPVNLSKKNGKIQVKGKVTIDRTQFDIKYNSSTYFQDLGNYAIKNEFDLSFDLCFEE